MCCLVFVLTAIDASACVRITTRVLTPAAVCSVQIGAAFHSSNVSIYMVDLKKVQPFGRPQIQPEEPTLAPPVFRHNQHVRKSFIKEKPPDGNGNE